MSSLAVSYSPHPDATPEAEVSALIAAYAFILDSEKKEGRLPDKSGPDDAKEGSLKHEVRAKASIHQ